MARDVRSNRRLAGVAAIAGLAAVAALLGTASAPAAPDAGSGVQAGHKCLVMAGSGDPAFVKNFNPFTAQGQPSGQFVRGAFYEPLIISSVAGGGHTYPWLAQSWKWSDGKPLTSADVAYSLTAGKQDTSMDLVGYASPETNIASVTTSGRYAVVI